TKQPATRSRPTLAFQCFVQNVINATAVSQAVLVLSLWYIERLRSKNIAAVTAGGSEYRLCATGMMLANKYLDDNTYTSKTWSSMTGIPLNEMNLMEIEFLASLDHNVGISDEAYLSWL
ncbi:cyclin PHO80-like protein, partial [Filobasidium floriforme]|uniref:cyclin PHO80-like protein n=1 Tax=Filobasidium floriforme TaxID=5210 RepID=UPI001E8EDFCB